MAVDDEAGPLIDHDLLDPAHRVERAGQRRLLVAWMETPVRRVARSWSGASSPEPVIRLRHVTHSPPRPERPQRGRGAGRAG